MEKQFALLILIFFACLHLQAQCVSQESITSTGASQTMGDGTTVNLSSTTNAQSNRLFYGGISGYWLGDGNSDESILFTLSVPTTEMTICATAHSCSDSYCEHFKLNINGSPFAFDPANLTIQNPDCAIVDNNSSIAPLTPDCHFCYDVTLQSGINNFEIIHDNVFGSPAGTVYDPVIGIECDPIISVPTLSQWGIIILSLLIFIVGVVGLKNRKLALE